MPDNEPALSFAIDSSPAQRAIGVLETLQQVSGQLTRTNAGLVDSNQSLTQAYSQQRDRLGSLVDQTRSYGGTIGGLVDRLAQLRPTLVSGTPALQAYTDVMRQGAASATQLNTSLDALTRYGTAARNLGLQTQDLATGLDRITAALQNQTIAGHETALTLGRLGVSVEGVAANRPDVILQQLADRIRGFRDTQLRLSAVQEVLGPSADAATVQALERQPYVPLAERQRRERSTSAQAEIDATQVQVQRRADELDRNSAQLTDLRSQYSFSPTLLGSVLDPVRRLITSRNEQRDRLEQISRLPASERRRYETVGFQVQNWLNQVDTNPGSTPDQLPNSATPFNLYRQQADAARARSAGEPPNPTPRIVTALAYAAGGGPVAGNLLAQIAPAVPQTLTAIRNIGNGTYASRQQEIAQRAAEEAEASAFGSLGALPARIGRSVRNLAGLYQPLLTQDDRQLSPYEQRILQQQSAGVLAQAGDASLQNIVSAQQAQQIFETPEIRRRLQQAFGDIEGARRFDLGVENRRQQATYAARPQDRIYDQIAREQELLRVPVEERARARFQQGLAEQLGSPFITGREDTSFQRLSAGEQAAGRAQFEAQQAGTAQERTQTTQDQITFQKQLAAALTDGRAAAENYTRAYQAFRQAQLEGAGDTRAGQQALEALNVTMAQRITQGTALVTQMERETAAVRRRLDLTRDAVNSDPATRRAAELALGVESDRQRLVDEGQLPNPEGGSYRFFNRETGQYETRQASAPEAQGILDRYTQSRRTAIAQQGEQQVRDVSSNATDRLRDARALADIVRDQNVSLDRAREILETQNQLRDASAKMALEGHKLTLEELDAQQKILDNLRQQTAEQQRQTAIANDNARNLAAARESNLRADFQDVINRARPQDRPYLRAQLEAAIRSADARSGGTAEQQSQTPATAPPATATTPPATMAIPGSAPGAGAALPSQGGGTNGSLAGAPIADQSLPPEAQGVLRMIYGGEQGPQGYQTPPNRLGAAGRGQQIPETHRRAARLIGADPSDMSPVTQDRENWALAQEDYRNRTHGDLAADARAAMAGDQAAAERIVRGLNRTWTSLPGGAEPNPQTHNAFARLSPNLASSSPTIQAAGDTSAIDRNATATNRVVRTGQDAEIIAREEAANARIAAEQRQRALAGQPARQAEAGIIPSNPEAPADIQARDVAAQRRQLQSGFGLAQANIEAGTTQTTEDLRRQTAALHEGGAAIAEVDRQIQIDREVRERGLDAVNRGTRALQLQNEAFEQARKGAAEQHLAASESLEQQKAVNDLGVFATPAQEQAARELTRVRQIQARTPGLAESPEGQQQIADVKARQALAEQTQELQQMKQAASGAGQAVEGFLDNVIVRGEKAHTAVRSLGAALEQIAIRAFIVQPLERLANSLFTDLFGGDPSSGNISGQGTRNQNTPTGIAGGAGSGLLGTLFSRAGNALFGGGGSSGGGGGGGTGGGQPQEASSPGLIDRIFSGIGSLFTPSRAAAAPVQAAASPAQAAPIDISGNFQAQPNAVTTGFTQSEQYASEPQVYAQPVAENAPAASFRPTGVIPESQNYVNPQSQTYASANSGLGDFTPAPRLSSGTGPIGTAIAGGERLLTRGVVGALTDALRASSAQPSAQNQTSFLADSGAASSRPVDSGGYDQTDFPSTTPAGIIEQARPVASNSGGSSGSFFDRLLSGSLFSSSAPTTPRGTIDLSSAFQDSPQSVTTGVVDSVPTVAGAVPETTANRNGTVGTASPGQVYEQATAGGGGFIGTTDTVPPPRIDREGNPTGPLGQGQAISSAIAGAGGVAARAATSSLASALRGNNGSAITQPGDNKASTSQSGGLIGAIIDKIGGPGFYEGGGLIGQLWRGSSAQKWWQNSSIGQFFGARPSAFAGASSASNSAAGTFGGPLTVGEGGSNADLVSSAAGSPAADAGIEAGNFDATPFTQIAASPVADAATSGIADAASSGIADSAGALAEGGSLFSDFSSFFAFRNGGIFDQAPSMIRFASGGVVGRGMDTGQPSARFADGGVAAASPSAASPSPVAAAAGGGGGWSKVAAVIASAIGLDIPGVTGDGARLSPQAAAQGGMAGISSGLAQGSGGLRGSDGPGDPDPSALLQAVVRPPAYASGLIVDRRRRFADGDIFDRNSAAPTPRRFAMGDVFAGESFMPQTSHMAEKAPLQPLQAYENQIVDRPVNFHFAGGASIGQMGEAGPEAILPLQRGPDGKLGVAASSGGGMQVTNNWNIVAHDVNSFHHSRTQIEAKTSEATNRQWARGSY